MNGTGKERGGQGAASGDRAARLKAALRENLKRRKAQARGRLAETPEIGEVSDVSAEAPKTPGDPGPDTI